MADKVRQVSNDEERKAKEAFRVIKSIRPVIYLIREWGVTEDEYLIIKEEDRKLEESIKQTNKNISLFSDDKDVCILINDRDRISRIYRDIHKEYLQLKEICEFYESKVIDYQEYARLFSWIELEDLKNVITLNCIEDKDEFLAIMFLVCNNDILKKYSKSELKSLEEILKDEIKNVKKIFENGWDYMLKQLKGNYL